MKDEGFKISAQDERIERLRAPQLSSKQEEADTKMFLAANYACNCGVSKVSSYIQWIVVWPFWLVTMLK